MEHDLDKEDIYKTFKELVNITTVEMKEWLETKEVKAVGWDSGDGESIGHKSGKKIVAFLQKKKNDLSEGDYKHMEKVVEYIKRHLAQKPEGDVSATNWNYSQRNWGHDYNK